MKISFNPSNSNKNILDLIKNNKDIIFDLKGHSIFARGVEFKGTDTNTWRPVVDNLTSDSTTSSLSAKQGKVLKALIDGKSNSDHNHDGRYVRYYAVTTLDCNNLAAGLTAASISATNAAHTNPSAYLYISNVGTPFQIQIPDSSIPYIYKRYYSSGKWSGWFKLNAGYADSATTASSANKLTTARNIALGMDLRGSANFDGSGNITINANINACTIRVGSTNGLPFKRIAHFETGGNWNDNALLLYISQGYINGRNGICRVEFRTDNISSSSTSITASAAVRWLVRNGYGLDSLYAGYYVTAGKAYIDIYLKTTGSYQGTVIRVLQDSRGGINSNVQLINSYYYSDTNHKEAYNSIEAASTALYNRAYTRIVSGSDIGTVSYSNSTGSVHWNNVTNKPSTFNPAAHTHTVFKNNLMIKGTNGVSDSASIHLGIGDSDTGFKWISDGVCQIYANNAAVGQWTLGGMNWFKNPTVNGNKVWNAGNDGSGSGLDADTLDGYHETKFFRHRGSTNKNESPLKYTGGTLEYYGNLPSGMNNVYTWGGSLVSGGEITSLQFYYPDPANDKSIYARTFWDNNDSGWHKLAFTDSKVADSDKLDGIHANGLLTALSNSNNGISITVGGTTKSISNINVNYAASAGNANTLDGIDSTRFLRQVVVPNNTENDFNTFSNMTLTGRIDPTTGASLKNAPWSGSGPAGGYGVLTYLFNDSRYGTQMAWGYSDNRIYIRNRYWGGSGVGPVWRTSWDTLALTSDIPTVTNYYWANVKISASSSTTTSPTVHTLTATRVCAGHNPGIDNSISCSNWFRSSGNTGWYNTTYQGGWYMSDTSWIRAHNGVGIYTSGQIYSSSSIRMSNILLEHTDEINNSANGGIHLNYRNSGNVSLCYGGGNVGIGTTTPSYKLDVNGQMRASGFHHSSVNSDNYILLAGGGYKSFGGDNSTPIFLGCLDLYHGGDGTISSSFYCLGYSVPFTYTRGGHYCKIVIPDTTRLSFYIIAATASVNYSGGGMDTWTGYHRGSGAWWLHCYASGWNEVRVKGFCPANENNDSWWGGNPLWNNEYGANRITVCIFGNVKYK